MYRSGGKPPKSNPRAGWPVHRLLWERILDRRLRPGEKLSALRLSHELGVSRTPVREALHRLVSDGITRAEPNRGFRVASYSAADITEVYDLRATLETMALHAAAPRLTRTMLVAASTDLDAVEARLATAGSEEERLETWADFLEVDRGFHRLLVDLAGNSRLRAIVEGLWAQIAVFQRAGSFRHRWTEAAIRRRRVVIAVLLAGDTEGAATELRAHIDEVKGWAIADLGAPSDGPTETAAAESETSSV